jgi:hypothetical protein
MRERDRERREWGELGGMQKEGKSAFHKKGHIETPTEKQSYRGQRKVTSQTPLPSHTQARPQSDPRTWGTR